LQTFDDMSHEVRSSQPSAELRFALWVFADTAIAIVREHLDLWKDSMKHKPVALAGLALTAPWIILFAGGLLWQMLYGLGLLGAPNLGGLFPSRTAGLVIIALPTVALALNAVALGSSALKPGPGGAISLQFLRANWLTIAVMLLGASAPVFLFGHDAVPCFVNGILRTGLRDLWPLLQACRNA
jgi:hypothetical protein